MQTSWEFNVSVWSRLVKVLAFVGFALWPLEGASALRSRGVAGFGPVKMRSRMETLLFVGFGFGSPKTRNAKSFHGLLGLESKRGSRGAWIVREG